jgi:hypothetical protein
MLSLLHGAVLEKTSAISIAGGVAAVSAAPWKDLGQWKRSVLQHR